MADKKLCPLAVVVGIGQDECAERSCAWWHGGMCDVSRIACSLAAIEVAELADARDHISDHGHDGLEALVEMYERGDA